MKLSFPLDPVGPSLMTHNRALHNPPIAVPDSGLPSHQSSAIKTDFLLVCEAFSRSLTDGRWRFTLEEADGELILDAEDYELGDLNRLTLLAAVRGLEALEGPSSVTLLSNNRYLIRSLSNSLPRWRQNNFRWDHFGRRIDVQHADLWRRIDHALQIHRVQACLVSSCLVSLGVNDRAGESRSAAGPASADGTRSRIDPAPRSSHSDQRGRAARSVVPAPSQRLRQLINDDAMEPTHRKTPRRKGRFTADDLEAI